MRDGNTCTYTRQAVHEFTPSGKVPGHYRDGRPLLPDANMRAYGLLVVDLTSVIRGQG